MYKDNSVVITTYMYLFLNVYKIFDTSIKVPQKENKWINKKIELLK